MSPHDPSLPAVSVLIAVHNGLPYLEQAMRSVMTQTLREIEIIVVDDASTDDTPAVLARLAAEDPRIRVLTLPSNLKLAGALNEGLAMARAPYVARMDADDLCHPTRLEVQKRFMDDHPGVILSGTSLRYIDGAGEVLRTSVRARDAVMCRWLMRTRSPLPHPAFMFRRLLPDKSLPQYDKAYSVAQDHDFAVRILAHGDVVCMGEVLMDYRMHGASITSTKWKLQQKLTRQTSQQLLAIDLSPQVIANLEAFHTAFFEQTMTDVGDVFGGLREMIAFDSHKHPSHSRWFHRQGAQLALESLQRIRLSKGAIAGAFLRHGRDFIAPLGLRLLEIRTRMPRRMRSD